MLDDAGGRVDDLHMLPRGMAEPLPQAGWRVELEADPVAPRRSHVVDREGDVGREPTSTTWSGRASWTSTRQRGDPG